MLRQRGFVYTYYTSPRTRAHAWQVYRVHASGVLIEVSRSVPLDEEARFSCHLQPDHPNDLRTLCVQLPHLEPEKAGPVWIGFSMNWWDDAMRQLVLRDPAAAGMVRINPLAALGAVTHAFQATPELIEQYVADFAMISNVHDADKRPGAPANSGLEPAWPLYNGPYDKTYRQAAALCETMRQQAARHPLTQGKQFVLTLPDPVGYVADLNAIRLAKARANARAWQKEELAWPTASYERLQGVRQAMLVAAAADPENKRSDRLLDHADARAVPPELARRRGERLGEQRWSEIVDQLDKSRFDAWPAKRDGIIKKQAQELKLYEGDWMAAWATNDVNALGACFKYQYNPADAAHPHALASCGRIYASEVNATLFPQPGHSDHTEQWLGRTIGAGLLDEGKAMALRAIFGNDKSVIDEAYKVLIGDLERSGGDWRDKTYNLIKGVLETNLGRKVNWLHPTVMAYSMGSLGAMTGAVYQLTRVAMSKSAAPEGALLKYQNLLPRLTMAQQNLEHACAAAEARSVGKRAHLNIAVLVESHVDQVTAVRMVYGQLPRGEARKAEARLASREGKYKVVAVTDLDTVLKIHKGEVAINEVPGAVVDAKRGSRRARHALKDVLAEADALPGRYTPEEVAQVFEHRQSHAELKLSASNARLALGAAVVQGLGMLQSTKALVDELTKAHGSDPAVLKNATLGVVDGVSGVTGSMMDLMAARETARLIVKDGTGRLVQASTRIAVFKTASAFTNVLGAGIAVYVLMGSREKAEKEGDAMARTLYGYSIGPFGASIATSGYVVADQATLGAVSRAVGTRIIALVGRFATVEVAAAAVAGTVTGVNLLLLFVGTAAFLLAQTNERSALQRWAGRSYFGKDTAKRHKSDLEESVDLSIIIDPSESEAETKRLASHAVPRTQIDPPSNPMGDGWGGGLE